MYTILVADDEALIREGIQLLFDYGALGYRICGEAADGEQTLEKIRLLQPDVVLMDIRMPGMTGLEVIGRARAEGYRGKVIIISSYSDFKYAQEAIRQGVQYYITKPIDEDELAGVLRDFKVEFDRELHAQSASAHYRRKACAAIVPELLLGDGAPSPSVAEETGLLADSYQAVIYERYNRKVSGSLPDFAALLRVNNQDGRFFERATVGGMETVLLKGAAAQEKLRELLHRLAHEKSAAQRGLLDGVFLSCGGTADSLPGISGSYAQALHARERRFFCGEEQHFLCGDTLPALRGEPVLDCALLEHYTARLLSYVQTFNRSMMAQTLGELQDRLCTVPDSIESVKLFLTDLHLQIKEKMSRLYPGGGIPFYTNAQLIAAIDSADFLYEIIRFLAQRFETMMSAIGTSSRDSVLDDILRYIDHNYAQNITLESIAPLFGYNHSYLGKIFAKRMGQSFNSYVDHVRIAQAKRLLLRDDAKVYAIAERVGYRNVDYFHIKFKKYVGQSPAEFRKKNRGSEE